MAAGTASIHWLRDPVIADGYHRVSAAYRVDEDSLVPGRLLWLS